MGFDVRRLTAVDLHGTGRSPWRRHVIRAEFIVGAVGCLALGFASLVTARGAVPAAVGVWLVGVGLNYVPLVVHAQGLSHPGALQAELAGVDLPRELARYARLQLWLAVPLAIVVLTVSRRRRSSS